MFEKEKESNKRKNIPSVCKGCSKRPCEDLYWTDVIVLPDYFAAPFDCPLLVKSEDRIRSELRSLNVYDVSRFSGEVWVKHNFGSRYVDGTNRKAEEIDHILSYFRRNMCIVLSKAQSPDYKPWTLSDFFTQRKFDGMPPMFEKSKKKKEEPAADVMTDGDADAENLPLEIKNLRWKHNDEQLKKDSPDTVSEGDTIKLFADFENYIDGAGVDFFVSDRSTGTKKQLKEIHTRCKNMTAEVEWEVDLSKAGEEPDIIFDIEARSLLRGPCEISMKKGINFRITLRIDPNEEESQDDTIKLFSTDDAKTYEQILTVKDDKEPDDNLLTLEFAGVDDSLKYTLEVDPGKEASIYFPFEEKTVKEITGGE